MKESGKKSSLIIGSLNDSMYIFDMNQCKISKEISVSSGVTCMTKTMQKICSGHVDGTVTLKDHRTHRDVQSFKAHSDAVSSIDARSHLIVTCGYTQRNGRFYNDNMVKVYDIRMNRILEVINYKGAKFVKFHPSYSSVAFLVNHRGQFKLTDISTNMIDEFYDSGTNEVYGFNVSSSGNVIGFTDHLGYIHIWADREDMPINPYSHNNIEFVDEVNPPILSEWSSFTLPSFYQNMKSSRVRKTLLSDWDNDSFFATTKPSETIDPELIKDIRYDGYVGIIPNIPGTKKRNQTKRFNYNQLANEKYVISKNERQTEVIKFEPKKLVPMNFKKLLQVVDEKKSPFETFEFYKFNKTSFFGLENALPNSYCNPIIQVLYYTPHIRVHMMNHLCEKQNCLLCELGFLFYMLDFKTSEEFNTVQAKNFLRSLTEIDDAIKANFFEEDNPNIPQSHLLERFFKFILPYLNKESIEHKHLNSNITQEQFIDTFYGYKSTIKTHCSICNKELENKNRDFHLNMKVPHTSSDEHQSFASILRKSLNQEEITYFYCEQCQTFNEAYSITEIENMPNIMCVSFDTIRQNSNFWASVSDEFVEKKKQVDHWIPFNIQFTKDKNNRWNVKELNELSSTQEEDIYELFAVISTIKNPKTKEENLVAQIKIHPSYFERKENMSNSRSSWFLFNDFHVINTSMYEAVHIDHRWKIPSILFFMKRNLEDKIQIPEFRNPITKDVFFLKNPYEDILKNKNFRRITEEELDSYKKVALDSEFVLTQKEEIIKKFSGKRNMKKLSDFSLARVSVLGVNKDNIDCFMDDYISTKHETVIDYLTQYSGISPGDLDPKQSEHYVTPLKYTYMKLRYLVDSGKKLIGHGLIKDFRIINIAVPEEQVIDTVKLFRIEGQRLISLKFLASFLLKMDIQENSHDSIEDSKAALLLYKKYKELIKNGTFEDVLNEIYKVGRSVQWKSNSDEKSTDIATNK